MSSLGLAHNDSLNSPQPDSSPVQLEKSGLESNAANTDAEIYKLFYREVARVPLLTAEGEMALIENIHKREYWIWFQLLGLKQTVKNLVQGMHELPNTFKKNEELRRFSKVRNLQLHAKTRSDLAHHLRKTDICLALASHLSGTAADGGKELKKNLQECLLEVQKLRDKFTRSNLRLVASVAKRFDNRRLGFMDKIQEGSMGLLIGLQSFDTKRGLRFSTYGHWWIRQSIERGIQNQGATIRIPVHVHEHMRAYKKCLANLSARLGRAPSFDEVTKDLGLSPRKIRQLEKGLPRAFMSPPKGEGTQLESLARVSHEAGPDKPEMLLSNKVNARELMLGLSTLKPIEREVLARRFGLFGEDEQTLEIVGEKVRLTRERIRQIQLEALEKIRLYFEDQAWAPSL
ncbi:MAG: hypothetical protein CMH56_13195 [Myxococcales bacterium]|nr:hypothetical protein [Myxococcales bacterium]